MDIQTASLIFQFMAKSNGIKGVKRAVYSTGDRDNKEDVAQHTWSMSLIFWLLREDLKEEFPDIDSLKVYDMIQLHDIIEVYVGDVSTFEHLDSNLQRMDDEDKAKYIVSRLLPEGLGKKYIKLMEELDAHETIEAKVVKGIDRISPAIQRYITGQGWLEDGISMEKLDSIQMGRMEFSTNMKDLYLALKSEAIDAGLIK